MQHAEVRRFQREHNCKKSCFLGPTENENDFLTLFLSASDVVAQYLEANACAWTTCKNAKALARGGQGFEERRFKESVYGFPKTRDFDLFE